MRRALLSRLTEPGRSHAGSGRAANPGRRAPQPVDGAFAEVTFDLSQRPGERLQRCIVTALSAQIRSRYGEVDFHAIGRTGVETSLHRNGGVLYPDACGKSEQTRFDHGIECAGGREVAIANGKFHQEEFLRRRFHADQGWRAEGPRLTGLP